MIIKKERSLSAKSIIEVMGPAISPREETRLIARVLMNNKQLRYYKNFFQLKKLILLWASSNAKIFDEVCFIKQRLMTLNYHCVNV